MAGTAGGPVVWATATTHPHAARISGGVFSSPPVVVVTALTALAVVSYLVSSSSSSSSSWGVSSYFRTWWSSSTFSSSSSLSKGGNEDPGSGRTRHQRSEDARSEAQDAIPCDVFENAAWRSRLPELTEMSLAKCGLQALSPNVAKCVNLVKLDLAHNDLVTLPDALAELPKLEILFVSGARRMVIMPPVLSKLTTVTRLGLRSNGIEILTADGVPPYVEHLILTDNRISHIEDAAYAKLGRVRKLMLANNRLEVFTGGALPAANLRSLELIRLANNDLKTLDPSVLALPRLAWIALAGNPGLFSSSPIAEASSLSRKGVSRVAWGEVDFGEDAQHLGSGASGVVRKASFRGKDVAVKRLQDRGSDGRAVDEIATIDALFAASSPDTKVDAAIVVPDSLVSTLAVVDKEDDDTKVVTTKASMTKTTNSYGLVLELLPRGVRDLAKPPTIVEITRDRYGEAERFAPRFVALVLSKVCRALAFLHARHVQHGDVYAHNILVEETTSTVKLGDLGAAFHYGGFRTVPAATNGWDVIRLLEKVEVRAFGVLVSELNARLSQASAIHKPLTALTSDCFNPDVAQRPTFAALQPVLDNLEREANREAAALLDA